MFRVKFSKRSIYIELHWFLWSYSVAYLILWCRIRQGHLCNCLVSQCLQWRLCKQEKYFWILTLFQNDSSGCTQWGPMLIPCKQLLYYCYIQLKKYRQNVHLLWEKVLEFDERTFVHMTAMWVRPVFVLAFALGWILQDWETGWPITPLLEKQIIMELEITVEKDTWPQLTAVSLI